jgi:DNA-binding NarL/FixJ family response regulator
VSVSVVVVDDHPLVRAGFHFLAEARPEIVVVGEAATADEAVEVTTRLRPDVVVMDVELAGGSGLEASARIRRDCPESRVLFVTMHGDESTVLAALRAGGSGFVLKGAPQDDLVRAILGAAAGDLVLGPHAGTIVADRVRQLPTERPSLPHLTAREHEILELLAAGRPNGSIAAALGVSRKTIANHVANILTKLHATDRGQAIVLAREAGFGR